MSFSTTRTPMIEDASRPQNRGEPSPEALADVNADLTRRVVVDTHRMTWEPSPSGTVWRKPLFRRGGEFGPVTSLVRYAPGGAFPDWIRSPHMSQHSPFSESGCLNYVRVGGL